MFHFRSAMLEHVTEVPMISVARGDVMSASPTSARVGSAELLLVKH